MSTEWARLWSARCCAQTSTYELPRSIVEAEDPAGAARHWASEKNRTKAHARVERAHAELRAAQAAYDQAVAAVTAKEEQQRQWESEAAAAEEAHVAHVAELEQQRALIQQLMNKVGM